MGSRRTEDARRHHYVPKFLLRHFSVKNRSGNHQVHVFDKSNSKEFQTAIENVAVEQDFNAIDDGKTRFSLEAGMAKIESDAASLVRTIVDARTLVEIQPEQRAVICVFAALQFVRGPDLRARFGAMGEHLRQRIQMGGAQVPEEFDEPLGGDQLKAIAFQMIQDSLAEFAQHFGAKGMALFVAGGGERFIIGDTPITLKNDRKFGPYGNIGLAVPGIQIYLPISPDLALGFWCPTLVQEFIDQLEDGKKLERSVGGFALFNAPAQRAEVEAQHARLRKGIADLDEIRLGFIDGAPISMTDENVIHLNSLQITYSERWVFSATPNFDLAKRMIADDPARRGGVRMKIN